MNIHKRRAALGKVMLDEAAQDDVNEKLFEAIKLINEKLDQNIEEQRIINKRIELAIDVMGARYCHDKDIVTARLNQIDEELSHTMGRLNNMEQVLEAIEFIQSNKKYNSRLDVVEEECRNFAEMQVAQQRTNQNHKNVIETLDRRSKIIGEESLVAKMANAEQMNELRKEQNEYNQRDNQCCK